MASCPACGAENRPGARFCAECGATLAHTCPACGTPARPGARFCDACGADLREPRPAAVPAPAPLPAVPVAERRLVSVLFADLVGFTSLAEPRDAEEVRDLLSRYFAICRRAIDSYGGTVEKFIGDAVMAVWGAPVAQEHDAELAVRAALELIAAVEALGAELGDERLRARAAVLTGEAAVTIGAVGEGMVAGDLVNTASRIQSLADPGTVLANAATRRAAEAAVVFAPAGSHEVKGRAEAVEVWRAVRVAAGRGGALKSTGLEPPFVGREREFRLLKDLFHDSAARGRAQLVSVVGGAGSGKSRLGWELFKYLDGLSEVIWWHRGRCLPYGEGVAYWALAEMVRMRSGIVEGEEAGSAAAKLAATLEQTLPDTAERRWVEPRLAHLLGIEERTAREAQELFGAWRLFFERLAEQHPLVLVFEDVHWADAGLLDFVEYLLDWSRSYPILVVTLARPELHERRPGWGAGKRGVTALYLEPLPDSAVEQLLHGVAPGLPDELRRRIRERAEGVPLYAVETVRMLLDRGLLVRRGDHYEPAGTVGDLDVPETLHALVAARLDALAPLERRALQDAAVIGRTFTHDSLAALSDVPAEELDGVLAGLVRKELVSVQIDPRSPECGHYGFLQDLVQRVAYSTLSRRERKSRHLAAAVELRRGRGGEEAELAEVLAAHYLAAYQAAPEDADAGHIREEARAALVRAAERAAGLAAAAEAQRLYESAIALASDPRERAALHEHAGQSAWAIGAAGPAREHLESAMELFAGEGLSHPAARVSARLGEVDWASGRLDEALERMERAYAVLAADEPDADLALLASQLGRMLHFRGRTEQAAERAQSALAIAEALSEPATVAETLTTLGTIAVFRGLNEYGMALLGHAIEMARRHDLPGTIVRAEGNLAEILARRDRYAEAARHYERALESARRVGNRWQEAFLSSDLAYVTAATGRWQDALAIAAECRSSAAGPAAVAALNALVITLPEIHIARGELDAAELAVRELSREEESTDVQERGIVAAARAQVLRARGDLPGAMAAAAAALELRAELGIASQGVKMAVVEMLEVAWALGDRERVEQLLAELASLREGEVPRLLHGHAARFRARLALADGEDPEPALVRATATFREIGVPLWLGVALFEQGGWLAARGRDEEAAAALDEAEAILGELGARAWLDRIAALRERGPRIAAADAAS